MKYSKKILIAIVVLLFIPAALFVYTRLDPAEYKWFPKCLFYSLTGLQCPGCGSQRAIHALLNGDFPAAVRYNVLTVAAIPYLGLGLILFSLPRLSPFWTKVKDKLYHGNAVCVILAIILVFWLVRNLI